MTNTHSIKELKIIEETLRELVKASKLGTNINHMLELLSDRAQEALPEIALHLIIADIAEAEASGYSFTNSQKTKLIDKSATIEEITVPMIRAA